MGRDRVSKHFGLLEPTERFHLMLAAAAREDFAEVKRLANACPRKTYTMNDISYVEQVRASRRVAMVWALRWEQVHAEFLLVHAPTYTVDGPESGAPEADIPPARLGPMLAATAQLLGVYLGLRWFCDAAGIDADHLVGAWCPWVSEPVQTVLDANPFVLLDDAAGVSQYGKFALEVGGVTQQMLDTEWGEGR